MTGTPVVLFLCTHNAGRSQMALGFFNHLAGERAIAWSGGSEPGTSVNAAAVAAMAERGIDISGEYPKPWTDEVVRAADVVITMGCGDACPVFPGRRYEEWVLDDPKGLDVVAVRPIRDEIEHRVRALVDELVPATPLIPRGAHTVSDIPSVLFVCVRNGGKSQMAAGLMRQIAGDTGRGPLRRNRTRQLDQRAVRRGAHRGRGRHVRRDPQIRRPELLHRVDLVVTLGRDARVDVPDGVELRNWDTDEPSERGIDGIERMRLIRDDITRRVRALAVELRARARA